MKVSRTRLVIFSLKIGLNIQ